MIKNAVRKAAKALRLARTPRYRRALWLGVGAAVEHERILSSLSPRGFVLVLDVGANVGQFTLVARQCLPLAAVIAFEPLSAAAERFRAVHGADPRVRLVEAALAPESGLATMHVSRAADSSSLLPIGAAQVERFPGTEESHTEQVRQVCLADVVPREQLAGPVLLKIDVQGFELGVLRGCEASLERIDVVYVECSFVEFYDGQALADSVVSWLQQRGFRFAGIGPVSAGPDGIVVQGDLLFVRAANVTVPGLRSAAVTVV